MIESSSNPQIKRIRKLLKSARFRRQSELFVAEGWKLTGEAIRRGLARAVYVSGDAAELWEEKKQLFEPDSRMPVEYLSAPLFRDLSDTVAPQGVLTLTAAPSYRREEMLAPENASLLILEDIQDPGNLGTMIRTAEGAGMAGLAVGKGCVDIFNPKVVRAAMGALFRVPFYFCDSLPSEVRELQAAHMRIYAAHPRAGRSYTEEAYGGRTGVLVGNEANGLSGELCACADVLVKIPMEGELESLNAAVSAALLMYEIHRKHSG